MKRSTVQPAAISRFCRCRSRWNRSGVVWNAQPIHFEDQPRSVEDDVADADHAVGVADLHVGCPAGDLPGLRQHCAERDRSAADRSPRARPRRAAAAVAACRADDRGELIRRAEVARRSIQRCCSARSSKVHGRRFGQAAAGSPTIAPAAADGRQPLEHGHIAPGQGLVDASDADAGRASDRAARRTEHWPLVGDRSTCQVRAAEAAGQHRARRRSAAAARSRIARRDLEAGRGRRLDRRLAATRRRPSRRRIWYARVAARDACAG